MSVAEDENVATGAMSAEVAPPRHSQPFFRPVHADLPVSPPQPLGTSVGREIIHDDDLTAGWEAGKQAFHGARQVLAFVVAYHHHADIRGIGHCWAVRISGFMGAE